MSDGRPLAVKICGLTRSTDARHAEAMGADYLGFVLTAGFSRTVPDDRVGEEVKLYVVLNAGLTRDDVTPERIIDHARTHLAPFKVPRYIEYRDSFPKTESDRVEKKKLTAGIEDLRTNSFDRVDGMWR